MIPRPCGSNTALPARSPRRAAIAFLAAALWATSLAGRGALAGPVYFPPDESGWPGGVYDESDVAPYLSFHKAVAMRLRAQRAAAVRAVATPAQQRYDARAYDLDLHAEPATQVLSGLVRVRATVTDGPLSALDLDLSDVMTVDSVTVAGAPAAFSHAAGMLSVSLGRAYAGGEDVDVTIGYHGVPGAGTFSAAFTFTTHNGLPLMWSLSEPFGAREWWPCKDAPEDKADSVTVRFTAPSGMITASNGVLLSSSDDGTHAVTQWAERHPIATYLVSIASFAYAVSTDWYRPAPADSMPIRFYMFPERVAGAAAVNARVKGMIAAYAARFGPYPYLDEKYGEAEFSWGGGMEHQTITSLGGFSEYVVCHELAHQWWGDLVTCRDFHHIWLNEGFATYGEALWKEAGGGMSAYHADVDANAYFGPGTIWVADEYDENAVFNGDLSYNKGSWVLHMLRHAMTDTLFFQALRQYGQQFGYGTATTEDFRDVCASVGGRDLDKYFTQWVYGEYYPEYRYGWNAQPAAGGGYDVSVLLLQSQPWQLFWMPVDVTITTATGSPTFVAWDSLATQSFTFHVDAEPTAVELDRDGWILKSVVPLPTDVAAASPGRLELAPPWPDPARNGALFSFTLPRTGDVSVRLYDVRGALVWEHREAGAAAGAHHVTWDGRDANGRAAPVGMYVVRLQSAEGTLARKLVVVR